MTSVKSLVEMQTGQSGVVTDVRGGGGMRRRLDAMGIRLGARLTKTSDSYLRGPVTVRTGNSQLALGFGMAAKVLLACEQEYPA